MHHAKMHNLKHFNLQQKFPSSKRLTRGHCGTQTDCLGREWIMPWGSEVSALIKSPKQEEPSQWQAQARRVSSSQYLQPPSVPSAFSRLSSSSQDEGGIGRDGTHGRWPVKYATSGISVSSLLASAPSSSSRMGADGERRKRTN